MFSFSIRAERAATRRPSRLLDPRVDRRADERMRARAFKDRPFPVEPLRGSDEKGWRWREFPAITRRLG